jgi:hypothetical protein
LSGYLQQTVGINFEGRNQFCLPAKHRGNAIKLKLAEQTVVAALGTLALVSLEGRLTKEKNQP